MQISAILRTAGKFAWKSGARGKRLLFPQHDYVRHKGTLLPAPELRFNGPEHRDDAFYLASAIAEADRAVTKLGYAPAELLVDVGCGQGRLAIGLIRRFREARYLGLDVSGKSIEWCRKHIEKRYPSYQFRHVNLVNARYNPGGSALSADFHLPVADAAALIVYMYSVVTNMQPEHLEVYAREASRMLRPGGRLFLTANVEDNVPEVSINPENYTAVAYSGPLHLVRYEKRYFLSVFELFGLRLIELGYHAGGNCQSHLFLRKQ